MTYVKGYIENVPAPAASVDVVISNGVINLATDKSKVFSEVARLLKSGGRFAISDIVTEVQLPENIVCNSTLWAACIGGAAQQDNYRDQIAAAGMKVIKVQDNPTYQFISDNARGASKKFGVKSISLLAVKPRDGRGHPIPRQGAASATSAWWSTARSCTRAARFRHRCGRRRSTDHQRPRVCPSRVRHSLVVPDSRPMRVSLRLLRGGSMRITVTLSTAFIVAWPSAFALSATAQDHQHSMTGTAVVPRRFPPTGHLS